LSAWLLIFACALAAVAQAKAPIIVIPGLIGSELINSKTGQKVWFKTRRVHTDDLRLPIGPNLAANRDSLIPGDILRDVKSTVFPRTDVYGGLLAALAARGYREGKWDAPPAKGYENTVYVFPYDWRRDNVENARLLIRKVEMLKSRLRRPNLKFDVIAHSMGGLIARYAAMYGNADLPAGNATPTWAGAKDFDKIALLGTPSGGSIGTLKYLINGVDIVGLQVNLPFVQNLSKFDAFTIPSAFQLLPAPGTIRAFDDALQPVSIDIYDPAVWSKYGWNASEDKEFAKEFTPAEQRVATTYFNVVLDRAKRFYQALSAASVQAAPVHFEVIGGECKDTLDGMILGKNKDGSWTTLFKADSYTTNTGQKVTAEELKKILYAPGDGVVTFRSLLAFKPEATASLTPVDVTGPGAVVCENHDKLPGNPEVQADVMSFFSGSK